MVIKMENVFEVSQKVKFKKVVDGSALENLLKHTDVGGVKVLQEMRNGARVTIVERSVGAYRVILYSIVNSNLVNHSYLVQVMLNKKILESYRFVFDMKRDNKGNVYSDVKLDVSVRRRDGIVSMSNTYKIKGRDAVKLFNKVGSMLYELFETLNKSITDDEANKLMLKLIKVLFTPFADAELYYAPNVTY